MVGSARRWTEGCRRAFFESGRMTLRPIYQLPPDFEVTDPHLSFAAEASGWGVPKELFDKVWERTTGKGIVIANLDSGVRSSHKLFQQPGKIIARRSFVGGNVEDDNSHGTMTASNSAGHHDDGDYVGVAPDAKLVVAKVFTSAGSGPAIDMAVVKWAISEGAEILNYSGGGNSPYEGTREAAEYAWGQGVIPVASSGNAGPGSKNWPAFFSNWLSVGATKQSGGLASFSTTNQQVDIAAPGEQVTVGNMSGGYSRANGTSFSCPWISGGLALILQLRYSAGGVPFNNIDELRTYLIAHSGPDVDPNPNQNYGALMMEKILAELADPNSVWL